MPQRSVLSTVGMSTALILLLSATWILSSELVAHHPSSAVAAGRSLLSCVGLLAIGLRRPRRLGRPFAAIRRRPLALMISGLLGVTVYSAASLHALALLGAPVTNLIIAMTPCVTLAAGRVLLGKQYDRMTVLAVALTIAGATAYASSSLTSARIAPEVAGWGLSAAVIALLTASAYGLQYGHMARDEESDDLLFGVFLFGTVGLIVVQCASEGTGDLLAFGAGEWALLAILGIGIYVPAYVIQHRLIQRHGAVFTATLSLAVPIIVRAESVALGRAQLPTFIELVGAVGCLIGVGIVVRRDLIVRRQ